MITLLNAIKSIKNLTQQIKVVVTTLPADIAIQQFWEIEIFFVQTFLVLL